MATPSYDGAAAAASVIMSPTVRARPVLFVEGICEVRLLAQHYPDQEAQIIPCGGHSGVKDAITAIEKWEAAHNTDLMVLGFIDRDYGSRSRYRRITVTNNRDVEIDLYKSKAGERMLKEKASRNKCADVSAVLHEAIKTLRVTGLIRKHNAEAGRGWCLNEVNLERCLDSDGALDVQKFITSLQQKNALSFAELEELRHNLITNDDIMTEAVIRGHDLSTLLGKWLRKRIGNRNNAETFWGVLEENLRLATENNELLRYHWARRIREHLTRQIQRTR